jgi:hypothetical protein
MNRTACIMLASLFLAASVSSLKAEGELNQTAWKVYEVGKIKSSDTLIFENGKIHSDTLAQKGFEIKKFQTYQIGYKVSWIADLANTNNEKIQLSGDMKDRGMKGERTYIDSNGRSTTDHWIAKKVSE